LREAHGDWNHDAVIRQEPRAILFDLDDTILDDGGAVARLWLEVSAAAARRLGVDAEALLAAIEEMRTWYWSDPERHRVGRQDLREATRGIVAEAFVAFGVDDPDLARWVADEYRERRDSALDIFPGAVETLERVRARGVRTALLTNGAAAPQRAKIDRFDLARHFDCIFIEGEFGRGKPDPDVYRAALAAVGKTAAETWMVGDNLEWDVAAPQRLGIFGIWIDRDERGLPPASAVKPDRIIRHIGELLAG